MGFPSLRLFVGRTIAPGADLHANKMALMERLSVIIFPMMNSDDESISRADFGASRRSCSTLQLFASLVKDEKKQPL